MAWAVSQVAVSVLTVKSNGLMKPLFQARFRLPAGGFAKGRKVAVVITDVNYFLVVRKGNTAHSELALLPEDRRKLQQRSWLGRPQIEDPSVTARVACCQQQRVDNVLDIIKIATLVPASV